MEKLLLVNVKDSDKLIRIASNLKIRCSSVLAGAEGTTLGDLCKCSEKIIGAAGESCLKPEESLLIFCDITDKHMDKILFEIRRNNMDITYKAALTMTNKSWTIDRMISNMRMEKMSYEKRGM